MDICCRPLRSKNIIILMFTLGVHSVSTSGSQQIRILNKTLGYETHKMSENVHICGFRDEAINSSYDQEIECEAKKRFCFAAVAVNDRGDTFELIVINQGCWPDKPLATCDEGVCVIRTPIPTSAGRILPEFCCCKGLYCNLNLSYVPRPIPITNDTKASIVGSSGVKESNNSDTIVLGVVSSVFALALIIGIILVSWRCMNQRKALKLHLHTINSVESGNEVVQGLVLDLNNIAFGDLIHQGHYSTVTKGRYEGCDVVVKSYPPHSHGHWQNERSIYYMIGNHQSIAKFLASFEVGTESGPQGVLVMEYYPNGSLLTFLKQNTLTWDQMCQLALTVTNGLAYLHGEVDEYCTDQVKRPVIVHRDLNSRNVLVKLDGSCVLADFGFAVHLVGKQGEPYPEVGTVRYMPPEMLGGAVNWHDESALKQADVYSLGLVLWEIATRCKEPYGDDPVPEAKLPYEEELPCHPTPDTIHQLVVHDFKRPAFPEQWKKSHFVYQLLRDTIEECWDQEPEARLTALCVVRRIQEVIQAKQIGQLKSSDRYLNGRRSLNGLHGQKDSILKNIVSINSVKPAGYHPLSTQSDHPTLLIDTSGQEVQVKEAQYKCDKCGDSCEGICGIATALPFKADLLSARAYGSEILAVPAPEERNNTTEGAVESIDLMPSEVVIMSASLPLDLDRYSRDPAKDNDVTQV